MLPSPVLWMLVFVQVVQKMVYVQQDRSTMGVLDLPRLNIFLRWAGVARAICMLYLRLILLIASEVPGIRGAWVWVNKGGFF